jgi:hypothetical protein
MRERREERGERERERGRERENENKQARKQGRKFRKVLCLTEKIEGDSGWRPTLDLGSGWASWPGVRSS